MVRIVVAGVGPGMGCSISRHLKARGNDIALISRSDFGKKLAADLGAPYRQCDLTDRGNTATALNELAEHLGGIDALVHCAGGFFGREPFLELTEEQFTRTLMNNSVSFFNTASAAVTLMKDHGGSITGISAAKNVYYNGNAAYAAGKGAIAYMARSMAAELSRYSIRVNTIAPGFIKKDDCGADGTGSGLLTGERLPSRYIAYAVESVIANDILTGQDIEVDGGVSTQIRFS